MLPFHRFSLCAVLATGIALPAAAQTPPQPFASWIAELPAQGYAVTQGSAYEISNAPSNSAGRQSASAATSKSSTAANGEPAYAYLETSVPVGSAYVDPYYGTSSTRTTAAGVAINPVFRLDTTEAVITIINMPPLAAYFSFQTNLYTRPCADYAHAQRRTADPARAAIFGSINNGINNAAIAAQAGIGFGSGAVAIITTANAALAQSLTAAFVAAGGNPALVFADPIGANANPGLDANADEFISLLRYSVAQNPAAASAWGSDAADNILVYRIDQPAAAPVTPYGAIPYYAKGINSSEAGHAAALGELSQLLQSWLAGQQGAPALVTPTHSTLQVSASGQMQSGAFGAYCIAMGTDCGGDEQDSDAYKVASFQNLPAGKTMIVDGVDHTASNDATYFGLSIQDINKQLYVAIATQANPAAAGFASGTISGSAAQALTDLGLIGQASPALLADLPNLWVQIYTRGCDPTLAYCTRAYTTTLPASVLPVTDAVKVTERAYVLPGALNGANPDDLLDPQVIK